MRVFVTVGSTRFDSLVQTALTPQVISCLISRGYTTVVIQCGRSQYDAALIQNASREASLEVWDYKPSLAEDFKCADLIISHAGSGTILDVLRLGKPLIVVPNPTLLDNHQEELARALADEGYLISSTVAGLEVAIRSLDVGLLRAFPPFDGSRFRGLVDEEMGI